MWIILCYVLIFIPRAVHGEVYLIQHYVIKFASDLRLVGGFIHVRECYARGMVLFCFVYGA
jgi:hypothetical protein